MSTFKNVTKIDFEVRVDGRSIDAPAGETFKVADEFDYQFADQPAFELTKSKAAPVVESTPEPSSVTEGAK